MEAQFGEPPMLCPPVVQLASEMVAQTLARPSLCACLPPPCPAHLSRGSLPTSPSFLQCVPQHQFPSTALYLCSSSGLHFLRPLIPLALEEHGEGKVAGANKKRENDIFGEA